MNRTNDIKRILHAREIAALQNKRQDEMIRKRGPVELENVFVKSSCWPAGKR